MFTLKFQPPQNFASYRQSEIDNARIPTYTQMAAIPYISNRFALKRFLGLTEEELAENERLWREENDENLSNQGADASAEMRSAGVSSAGMEGDMGGMEDEMDTGEAPIDGGEGEGPDTATNQALGSQPASNPGQTI
jgi:hypothetical protein